MYVMCGLSTEVWGWTLGQGPVTTFQTCPTFEYHRIWYKDIGTKILVQRCWCKEIRTKLGTWDPAHLTNVNTITHT